MIDFCDGWPPVAAAAASATEQVGQSQTAESKGADFEKIPPRQAVTINMPLAK